MKHWEWVTCSIHSVFLENAVRLIKLLLKPSSRPHGCSLCPQYDNKIANWTQKQANRLMFGSKYRMIFTEKGQITSLCNLKREAENLAHNMLFLELFEKTGTSYAKTNANSVLTHVTHKIRANSLNLDHKRYAKMSKKYLSWNEGTRTTAGFFSKLGLLMKTEPSRVQVILVKFCTMINWLIDTWLTYRIMNLGIFPPCNEETGPKTKWTWKNLRLWDVWKSAKTSFVPDRLELALVTEVCARKNDSNAWTIHK